MATISSGSVTVTIQPGEQYRVIATGEAYVDIGGGSTQSYRLINGSSEKLLGGFIVATPVTIRVVSGSVEYINVSGTGDSVALSLAQSSRTDINGVVASTVSGELVTPTGNTGKTPILNDTKRLIYNSMLSNLVSGGGNKSTWQSAVTAGTAKVAVVGHSIINGNNQNFYGATVYNTIKRSLRQIFPTVNMTISNYGIGGARASQFASTGNPNTTISAPAATQYREFWESDSGALTTNGSWLAKVQTFAPDLLFIQFDLNETDYVAFGDALESILTSVAGWAKVPTVVLGTSHVGLQNGSVTPAIVRQCQRVTRAIAYKYKAFLCDAGRAYDLLTGLGDPEYSLPIVSGEIALLGQVASATNVPTSLIDNIVGTAYSPTGSTIRDASSGSWRFNRKNAAIDGAIQSAFSLGATTGVASLFYRVQTGDANYATGTGAQMEIRVSDNGTNTLMQAYYWTGGAAVAISGATFNFTTRIGTNTKFQLRVEYKGALHTVKVFNPTSGVYQEFSFVSHKVMDAGYVGIGVAGTGAGFIDVGSAGNVSTGVVIENWSTPTSGFNVFSDAELMGLESSAIWNASYSGSGGNSINHPTNLGYKEVYEYVVINAIKSLS